MSATNFIILVWCIIALPMVFFLAIKKPIWAIALIILSLPMFNQSKRLFQDPTLLVLSVETWAILLMGTGLFLRRVFVKGKIVLDQSSVIGLALFLFGGLTSCILAEDQVVAIKVFLSGGIAPMIVFLAVVRYVKSSKDMEWIVLSLAGLVLQSALFTLLALNARQGLVSSSGDFFQWMYLSGNPVIVLMTPSVTIATIAGIIPLCAWAFLNYGKRIKLLSVVTALSVVFIAIISLSRGSWLAVGVSLVGTVLMFMNRNLYQIILLGLIIIAAFFLLGFDEVVIDIFDTRLGSEVNTVDIRLANYALSLRSIEKHFFFGVGVGNYPEIYYEFPDDLATHYPHLWFAHNLFLTLIPEVGLLGALGFILFILSRLVRFISEISKVTQPYVKWFLYACFIAVISYLFVVLTSGGHLVAAMNDYFTSPALIVTMTYLGMITTMLNANKSSMAISKPVGEGSDAQ